MEKEHLSFFDRHEDKSWTKVSSFLPLLHRILLLPHLRLSSSLGNYCLKIWQKWHDIKVTNSFFFPPSLLPFFRSWQKWFCVPSSKTFSFISYSFLLLLSYFSYSPTSLTLASSSSLSFLFNVPLITWLYGKENEERNKDRSSASFKILKTIFESFLLISFPFLFLPLFSILSSFFPFSFVYSF